MSERVAGTATVSLVDACLQMHEPAEALAARLVEHPEVAADVARELCRRSTDELRKDPREARRKAELAVAAAEFGDNAPLRIQALRLLAQSHLVGGDFAAALDAFDLAVAWAHELDLELEAAHLNTYRVTALVHLERYDEAREVARDCLQVFGRHEEIMGLLRTHVALADVEYRTDRPRSALRHHACAEALVPDEGMEQLRAAIAANRANALEACNRFRAAQRHFEIARRIFAAHGCHHTVAQIEYNAAYRDFLAGRYEDALHRYGDVEASFRALGDARHLAHVAIDRAEVHLALNLPKEARRQATAAESGFVALGLAKEMAQAAHVLGRAQELLGWTHEARASYARARLGFSRLGLREREIGCLVQVARLELASDRREDARRHTDEARALLLPTMNPLSRISVDLLEAHLEIVAGKNGLAAARCKSALIAARHIHAPWVHIEGWRTLGRAQARMDQRDDAVASLREAVAVLEKYRGGVPPDEYMAAFLAARSGVYEELVDLLLARGDVGAAFGYAERAKSRALVDMLAQKDRRARRIQPTTTRLENLRTRLFATYQRLFQVSRDADSPPARTLARIRKEAQLLESELAHRLRAAQLSNPDLAALQTVTPPDLDAIRRDLEPGTCLLQYFVAKEWLVVFAVTRDRVHAVRHRVARADLRRRLERFHFHLSKFMRPHAPQEARTLPATRANLQVLTDLLLEPLRAFPSLTRLVVVPHNLLHHVPFHALPWDDGWLADACEVVYAPSAAVYGRCGKRRNTAQGAPCILAVPDDLAPQIEHEARSVAARFQGAQLALGRDATLAALHRGARSARVLHVVTHGMFRPNEPMLSSIRLADGWANLYDVYDLRVDSELVVLSTCESGTADVTEGDEVLGLTRGFLHAGARALLTSQWRVDDAATAVFMDAFYRALAREGDAAKAHRQAMASVRRRHPHPYFWAAFFLTGCPSVRHGPNDGPVVDPPTSRENARTRPTARQEYRS